MAQVFIDPESFKSEIENMRKSNEALPENPYTQDKLELQLEAIEAFLQATGELNQALIKFKELTEKDAHNLDTVLAHWMHVDTELAGMNAAERTGHHARELFNGN